ncbi:hypothetical protein ACFLTE_10275 [Bacteroidota bacterium]
MRTLVKYFLFFLFIFFLSNCDKDDDRIVLESTGGFPETPVNLSMFNSEYDDYNSDLEPGVYDMYEFVFSSNRNSKGDNFDLILYNVDLWYPYDKNILSISKLSGKTGQNYLFEEMLSIINSEFNEYGPFIYNLVINENDYWGWEYLLFYSQQQGDNMDIMFVVNEYVGISNNYFDYEQSNPYSVSLINTEEFNEGYISISNNKIYYCSDCNGAYDIFEMTIDSNENIIDFLTDTIRLNGEPIEKINSNKDDKCPYIIDNFMVFTSNREDGLGGYDLYYSRNIDNQWTKPVNYGTSINSEKDEFRPIVRMYSDIKNDLMIFSSNRDGGLGGYDLYYVGIMETK